MDSWLGNMPVLSRSLYPTESLTLNLSSHVPSFLGKGHPQYRRFTAACSTHIKSSGKLCSTWNFSISRRTTLA